MLVIFGKKNCSSRALLSLALRETFNIPFLPEILTASQGKPYLPAHPEICFSLSHSGNLTLCACGSRPVGVDIEWIKPRQNQLPRYALTALEYAQYLEDGGGWPAFYRRWTRKEAWCKYTGRGLADRRTEIPASGLHWREYAGSTWRATVCAEEIPPAEILWLD